MVIMIPEAKLKDQGMLNLMKEAHKESRTIVINHNLKAMLVPNTLLNVLDANALLAQKMLRHARE